MKSLGKFEGFKWSSLADVKAQLQERITGKSNNENESETTGLEEYRRFDILYSQLIVRV